MLYLLKTEPEAYAYADLEREGETVWDGVKNAQAVRILAGMRAGDRLAVYHSGKEKAAVGLARVVSVEANDPKHPVVRIKAVRRLDRPKALTEMRKARVFAGSPLLRQARLSVVPLTEEQYAWVAES